ncbi:hypothetical protein [Escherichia coli]
MRYPLFCTPIFNGFFKEFIFHRFFAEQALEFFSIKTITYLSDIGCLEIQGASLADYGAQLYNSSNEESTISLVMPDAIEWNGKNTPRRQYMIKYIAVFKY